MNINYVEHSDGTKLFSFTRHDFKEYKKDGEYIMIDGGFDYTRFSATNKFQLKAGKISNLIEDIREQFRWGRNYDAKGKLLKTTEYAYLKDLTTDHIFGILQYLTEKLDEMEEITPQFKAQGLIFLAELQYRHNSNYHDLNKQSSK